jgi:hypothetical protein
MIGCGADEVWNYFSITVPLHLRFLFLQKAD